MISFRNALHAASFEAWQFRILTRHFFLRLFRNDLVDFEDQMKERVIGILSILTVFSGLITYVFLGKYDFTPDTGQSWLEKMIIITFFMLIMGFVAIVEWDFMFLDGRDSSNLNPLPLRTRTILSAKFISLLFFVSLFGLGLNLLSSPFFIVLLPRWRSSSVLFFLGHAIVHFLIMFSACFFGFFFYVVLFGILQCLLGPTIFTKASTYLRSLFVIFQLFLILIYLRIVVYGLDNLISTNQLRSDFSKMAHFFNFFPPFWFTDLYETVLGSPRLPFHGRYKYALFSLAAMAIVFVLTMGLSYGRSLRRIAAGHNLRLRKIRWSLEAVFNSIFLRNSSQRAIFHFYRKTLRRSVFHRMRLATYFACGVALVPFLITMQTVKKGHLLSINPTLVSIPLVLSFALLLGLRSVMNMPVSLEANWVFRLTERPQIVAYFTGLRKAILVLKLGPLFILIFASYTALWDPQSAFYHSLYGLAVSILVMEILLIRSLKIPFACSYLPGKEKIQLYWLVYLIGFIVYLNVMSRLELELFRSRLGFIYFYMVVVLAVAGIRAYQVYFLYKRNRIQYEDEPEPLMVGLDYKTPPHKSSIDSSSFVP
jgi:hypothetical protein